MQTLRSLGAARLREVGTHSHTCSKLAILSPRSDSPQRTLVRPVRTFNITVARTFVSFATFGARPILIFVNQAMPGADTVAVQAQASGSEWQRRGCAVAPQPRALPESRVDAVHAARAALGHAPAEGGTTESQRGLGASSVRSRGSASATAWHALPASVKQLAAALRSGRLLSAASIQAQNAWLRFGWVVVSAGCALGACGAWRAAEHAGSMLVDLRNDRSFLASLVRSLFPLCTALVCLH